MYNSIKVISESGVQFGTSGARGLVTQFSSPVCAAFAHAFIDVMKRNFEFKQLALAIDNRPSSYAMAIACANACLQVGIEPVYYGVIPTPALAYKSMQDNMPCIMITGSHIPFDRNGLKFYRPDGEISKADEKAIVSADIDFDINSHIAELPVCEGAKLAYIERYTSLFSKDALAGKSIGIYEHSSAGRDLYADIFSSLGAEVTSLGRTNEFIPIDTEAVAKEDDKRARSWSTQYGFDAIFSTDGDGDRPLIADEKGHWLRGDILGLLCAKAIKSGAVVVPVSCNTAIETSQCFNHVERTRIGSPYVIAEFTELANKFNSVSGFEANGGFLLASDIEVNGQSLKALPTRDAVLPAIMLLASANKQPVSALVGELPKRFTASDRIQNFATEKSLQVLSYGLSNPEQLVEQLGFDGYSISKLDSTDGLRITLDNDSIIHLRPSGNAPELRCYAEAESIIEAERLVAQSLSKVQHIQL
ncbi:phosphomannomutase [Shewanella sp. Scap07]|uniref:phosphomannomutase n=1 Tax=Shewanella sp. Scap07 TaxID=2589987 RepID=UPI0015BCF0C3|nr:phosphomannomutase [Shewanella sp. Scap07]QLE86085.1 phosphomannomutase [Shewanella sp. Scap07]